MSQTPTADNIINVVIVDDHKLVRTGLKMLIQSHRGLKVVGEAGNCAEALELIKAEQPNVVLLDLDLKGESGLDLLPEIKTASPASRVLVLTGVKDVDVHRACVRQGAKGLVMKDLAEDVLVKAIRKVHEEEFWFDRNMMSSVLQDVLSQKDASTSDPEQVKIATLTKREKEVIDLVCQGQKNKQIAENLFISDTTVRHHLTSIFSKLEVSDRLELVIYAFRYQLAKPPK